MSTLGFHGETGALDQPRRYRRKRNINPQNTAMPPAITPTRTIAPTRTVRYQDPFSSGNRNNPLPPPANITNGQSSQYITASQIQNKVARWRRGRERLTEPSDDDEPAEISKPNPPPPPREKPKKPDAKMTSAIRNQEQTLQQIQIEMKKLTEQLQNLQLQQRTQQSQLDSLNSSGQMGGANEEVENRLRNERHQELKLLENNLRTSLQEIHDQTLWIYGICSRDVQVYSDPDLKGTPIGRFSRGTKILLIYPQRKNSSGVWSRTRTVETWGQIRTGWIPIYQYTPQVISHYRQLNAIPPQTSEKIINVEQFSVVEKIN